MKHFSTELVTAAIEKTARLLVKDGIKVTTRGAQAYVRWDKKGKVEVINLPMVPRDASQEFLAALQGFLDHEVAHVLYTDPIAGQKAAQVFQKESGIDGGVVHSMANLIEDVRIEACMERDYRGSASNLHNVRGFFSSTFTKKKLEEIGEFSPETAEQRRSYILPIYFRARGGQQAMVDFMDENSLWTEVEAFDKAFPDLEKRIKALKSTPDATRLAGDLLRAMFPPSPPPPPPPPMPKDKSEEEPKDPKDEDREENEDEQGGGSDGSSEEEEDQEAEDEREDDESSDEADEDTEADEDDEGDDVDQADDGDGDEDDEDEEEPDGDSDAGDEGDSGEPEDEEADDTGADGAEDDANSDDDPDATGDEAAAGEDQSEEPGDEEVEGEDSTEGDQSDADDSEQGEESSAEKMTIDPASLHDFDEAAAEAIAKAIGEMETSQPYHIFTRDNDVIAPAPISTVPLDLEKWEREVEQTTGVLRRELQRLIAAKSRAHNVPGYRRGRIHPGSLHRVMAEDDRVFSRKHEVRRKDTAFSLVVDLSGSMSGPKVHTALQSAWAFADTLDRLGVPCEVIGFTTHVQGYKNASGFDYSSAISEAELRKFADTMGIPRSNIRWEAIHMPIFKDFDERFSQDVKRRIASGQMEIPLLENIDGESVRYAAARIYQRKEARKVMIVFSDGMPACRVGPGALSKDLKDAVNEITSAGIETIGIGIHSDAVRRFYPKSFVIKEIGDLATTTLRQLKEVLAS